MRRRRRRSLQKPVAKAFAGRCPVTRTSFCGTRKPNPEAGRSMERRVAPAPARTAKKRIDDRVAGDHDRGRRRFSARARLARALSVGANRQSRAVDHAAVISWATAAADRVSPPHSTASTWPIPANRIKGRERRSPSAVVVSPCTRTRQAVRRETLDAPSTAVVT